MLYYCYANLTVSTTLPLAELRPVPPENIGNPPDIYFSPRNIPFIELAETDWIHHWYTNDGELTLSSAKHGSEFLIRFPRVADFIVSADGRQVYGCIRENYDLATLNHLLIDQVLPRVLAHIGYFVVHASAVSLGGHVIAFAGDTGRGKSTLAASLDMAGFSCLTDDALVITCEEGNVLSLPTYPSLRLLPSSRTALFTEMPTLAPVANYSDKRRVALSAQHVLTPQPLAAIYILAKPSNERPEPISVFPLSHQEACLEIISHLFQLDVSDLQKILRVFEMVSSIVAQVPVYTITYPRDFSSLPAVHAAIMAQHGSV